MRKHLISFGAAVMAAFVCWLFTDVIPANEKRVVATFLALFIGGAVHLIVLMFLDRNENSDLISGIKSSQERELATTRTDLTTLQKEEALTRTQLVELLRTVSERLAREEKLSHLFKYQGRKLDDLEMREVWLDLLTELQKSYYATNYIAPRRIYKTDWGSAALLIQNAKKKAYKENVIMKKVFLIDDDTEIAAMGEYLEEQSRIGVEIQYFPISLVDQDPVLSEKKKLLRIASIDFGVLDSDAVLVWYVNQERQIEGGNVLVGSEYVKNYKTFFNLLYLAAEERNRGRFMLINVSEEIKKSIRNLVLAWPTYKPPYEEMDYALRAKGWLWDFGARSNSRVYAAYDEGKLVGFSILVCETSETAEFYVAIHPGYIGNKEKRLGLRVTEETLQKGFKELGLHRIHLKVRKEPERRVQLYRDVGFVATGTKEEEINGKKVEFITMEITRKKELAQAGGA